MCTSVQGGRSWQPFGKNSHKKFPQAPNFYFRDNCVIWRVIANLQIYLSIICYKYHVIMHFLPKKLSFWLKKNNLFGQRFPKSAYIATNSNITTKLRMLGLKIYVPVQAFRRRPFVPSYNFCHPAPVFKQSDTPKFKKTLINIECQVRCCHLGLSTGQDQWICFTTEYPDRDILSCI